MLGRIGKKSYFCTENGRYVIHKHNIIEYTMRRIITTALVALVICLPYTLQAGVEHLLPKVQMIEDTGKEPFVLGLHRSCNHSFIKNRIYKHCSFCKSLISIVQHCSYRSSNISSDSAYRGISCPVWTWTGCWMI